MGKCVLIDYCVFNERVFNLSYFDLSLAIGRPPLFMQSQSSLCITTQMTDYFKSEKSFHLTHWPSLEIHV